MKNLLSLIGLICVALVVSASTYGIEYTVPTAIGLVGLSYLIPSIPGVAYMAIPTQDARSLFTKTLAKVYREKVTVTSFLRSFFPANENMTKEISIEVTRGTEKVATDVIRSTAGNRNKVSRSTEKIFVPPMYWEYCNVNELRLYDQVIAQGSDNPTLFAQLINDAADELMTVQKKIERAYELQCAQVLLTGIVTLTNGDNIDFKRKAASLVDLTATPWTTGTVDPYSDLKDGATFLRQVGKASGSRYNVIMGGGAYDAFLNNTIVKARADIRNYSLDAIATPQRNSSGASLQGVVSAGAYTFQIWTYPEYYDLSGTSTPYITDSKIIILPESPEFSLEFGAVPQLLNDNGSAPQMGAYLVQEFIDQRAANHETHIKSAGIAIPTAVDQIYTAEVIA